MKNDSPKIRLGKMLKNTVNKKRECILCDNLAINSHLLQKNGILSHIQDKGHVKQLKFNDIYKSNEEDGIIISNVGLKKAMTYKVFCNSHDTEIFKEIESTEINLENYRTNILLTYRALCAEIIKKDISIEYINKIKNASYFKLQFDFLKNIEFTLNENLKSRKELIWYKNELENEISNEENENFVFKTFKLKHIPICASAIYSPAFEPHINKIVFKNKERLDYISINLIPLKENLYLSLGYHKKQNNHWITDYINSWENVEDNEVTTKVTEIVSTKIENWAISPIYYDNIDKNEINKFKRYWNENYYNINVNQKIDFDIFHNSNK